MLSMKSLQIHENDKEKLHMMMYSGLENRYLSQDRYSVLRAAFYMEKMIAQEFHCCATAKERITVRNCVNMVVKSMGVENPWPTETMVKLPSFVMPFENIMLDALKYLSLLKIAKKFCQNNLVGGKYDIDPECFTTPAFELKYVRPHVSPHLLLQIFESPGFDKCITSADLAKIKKACDVYFQVDLPTSKKKKKIK